MEVNIHLAILSNVVKTMAYLDNILCRIHLNKWNVGMEEPHFG
jgi:hypothetical protein